MKILGIDTSAQNCSVCVLEANTDVQLSSSTVKTGKGHAEILLPQVEKCLDNASTGYDALDRIAVTTGPGSFAGLRVGIAAARGLAIALDIPVVGVGTLEALAFSARREGASGPLVSIISSRDNEFYYLLDHPSPGKAPVSGIAAADEIAALIREKGASCCGAAAREVFPDGSTPVSIFHEHAAPDVLSVARLGALSGADTRRPEPLYFRPPDAKPQKDFVLPRA